MSSVSYLLFSENYVALFCNKLFGSKRPPLFPKIHWFYPLKVPEKNATKIFGSKMAPPPFESFPKIHRSCSTRSSLSQLHQPTYFLKQVVWAWSMCAIGGSRGNLKTFVQLLLLTSGSGHNNQYKT